MKTHLLIFLKVIFMAFVFIGLVATVAKAQGGDQPAWKANDLIAVWAYCLPDTVKKDQPFKPSYNRLKAILITQDQKSYVQLMKELGTRCVDMRITKGQSTLVKLTDVYATWHTAEGKCFEFWRFKELNSEKLPAPVGFTWRRCPGEAT